MDKIIVTTPEELRTIIEEILIAYGKKQESSKPIAEHLTLDDAITFLKENGFPTSKAKMYRLTSKGKIPCLKYGNKLVFSRNELMAWVLRNSVDMNDHSEDLTNFICQAKKQ